MLSNAIKYAKEGEIPRIDVSTEREDRYVILKIKDQGIGMDLQLYRERLFQMFQRFHTHKEGMGVGLHLVHSIVEAYDGKIDVQSDVNQGTIFTIFLSNANGE